MIRTWHQSFTELAQLPAYQKAMDAHVRRSVRADTEVVLHGVKPGTYPGNYPGTDIAHSALYTLHASQWITQALKASDEGFDAYAMCSLPNPYIREIRSLVDMPVVGYGEASFHLACMLGHRFGLMVFIAPMAQLYSEQIDLYGLKSRCAGVKPVVFLLADLGYPPYSQVLVVKRDTLAKRGAALGRFVRASAEGWKRYLANPAPAHALIKQVNPQQEEELMNVSYKIMREAGLLESGDAKGGRIGVMTDARWDAFYREMVAAGALPPNVEVKKTYTLQFMKDI